MSSNCIGRREILKFLYKYMDMVIKIWCHPSASVLNTEKETKDSSEWITKVDDNAFNMMEKHSLLDF